MNASVRPIEAIPPSYQTIFEQYPCFNVVQSGVLDEALHTDNSFVVSAPTGSGKTAVFEIAIVRLLIQNESTGSLPNIKIVYISPMKALCRERLVDWHKKFSDYGIKCIAITSDTDDIDFRSILQYNLIISTPEKWDVLTRRWRDNQKLIGTISLFMIDEVHLLNTDSRGPTLEVIVSRMKTLEAVLVLTKGKTKIRFIALSATIPNVEDIADWIGHGSTAKHFKFSEDARPVKLNKVVKDFAFNPKSQSIFKFDLSLNYKLQNLISRYSEGKPTLIFCNTRKSVEMTANHLVQNLQIRLNQEQKKVLNEISRQLSDIKLKQCMVSGIAFHHAGLVPENRHAIEEAFRQGHLPILVTTSTLAMGVNLPAHLVIVKSTKCYDNGGYKDYDEVSIFQMIGRAGRSQFDTTATALILTTTQDKDKFERMVGCNQPIESNLHRHLTEHLNAEVVLKTITDLDEAMRWLSSTFWYVRARKCPEKYKLPSGLSRDRIDKKLLEICQVDLNKLVRAGMIKMNQAIEIAPTVIGEIMAKYYIAFDTMKLFTEISGNEIMIQILAVFSKCHEFSEIRLRSNDKKCLNWLNTNPKKESIRFPLNGKIKTADMKINCIIQAILGNLEISDQSILSDSLRIMRNCERISRCLIEYLETRIHCYSALLNAIILAKCFQVKLWENSIFVSKQLTGVGQVISTQLAKAGKTSFREIVSANPRQIEMIIGRKAPFGNSITEQAQHLPEYNMKMEKNAAEIMLKIRLLNKHAIEDYPTINLDSTMTLLVGDNDNNILLYEKYAHSYMLDNPEVKRSIPIDMKEMEFVTADFISDDWVGIDCHFKLEIGIKKVDVKMTPCKNSKQTFMEMYMKQVKNVKGADVKNINVNKDGLNSALNEQPDSKGPELNQSKTGGKKKSDITNVDKIHEKNSFVNAFATTQSNNSEKLIIKENKNKDYVKDIFLNKKGTLNEPKQDKIDTEKDEYTVKYSMNNTSYLNSVPEKNCCDNNGSSKDNKDNIQKKRNTPKKTQKKKKIQGSNSIVSKTGHSQTKKMKKKNSTSDNAIQYSVKNCVDIDFTQNNSLKHGGIGNEDNSSFDLNDYGNFEKRFDIGFKNQNQPKNVRVENHNKNYAKKDLESEKNIESKNFTNYFKSSNDPNISDLLTLVDPQFFEYMNIKYDEPRNENEPDGNNIKKTTPENDCKNKNMMGHTGLEINTSDYNFLKPEIIVDPRSLQHLNKKYNFKNADPIRNEYKQHKEDLKMVEHSQHDLKNITMAKPDSTVDNARFEITELLTPRSKSSLESFQQKNIRWRSPLVYSPPVKFSPDRFKFDLENRENSKESSDSRSGTQETNTSANTSHTSMQTNLSKCYGTPVTRKGVKVLLSDQDYLGTNKDTVNKKFKDNNYGDYVNQEYFGLGKHNNSQKKNYQKNTPEKPYACDYYSQLMCSQSLRNSLINNTKDNTSLEPENIKPSASNSSLDIDTVLSQSRKSVEPSNVYPTQQHLSEYIAQPYQTCERISQYSMDSLNGSIPQNVLPYAYGGNSMNSYTHILPYNNYNTNIPYNDLYMRNYGESRYLTSQVAFNQRNAVLKDRDSNNYCQPNQLMYTERSGDYANKFAPLRQSIQPESFPQIRRFYNQYLEESRNGVQSSPYFCQPQIPYQNQSSYMGSEVYPTQSNIRLLRCHEKEFAGSKIPPSTQNIDPNSSDIFSQQNVEPRYLENINPRQNPDLTNINHPEALVGWNLDPRVTDNYRRLVAAVPEEYTDQCLKEIDENPVHLVNRRSFGGFNQVQPPNVFSQASFSGRNNLSGEKNIYVHENQLIPPSVYDRIDLNSEERLNLSYLPEQVPRGDNNSVQASQTIFTNSSRYSKDCTQTSTNTPKLSRESLFKPYFQTPKRRVTHDTTLDLSKRQKSFLAKSTDPSFSVGDINNSRKRVLNPRSFEERLDEMISPRGPNLNICPGSMTHSYGDKNRYTGNLYQPNDKEYVMNKFLYTNERN